MKITLFSWSYFINVAKVFLSNNFIGKKILGATAQNSTTFILENSTETSVLIPWWAEEVIIRNNPNLIKIEREAMSKGTYQPYETHLKALEIANNPELSEIHLNVYSADDHEKQFKVLKISGSPKLELFPYNAIGVMGVAPIGRTDGNFVYYNLEEIELADLKLLPYTQIPAADDTKVIKLKNVKGYSEDVHGAHLSHLFDSCDDNRFLYNVHTLEVLDCDFDNPLQELPENLKVLRVSGYYFGNKRKILALPKIPAGCEVEYNMPPFNPDDIPAGLTNESQFEDIVLAYGMIIDKPVLPIPMIWTVIPKPTQVANSIIEEAKQIKDQENAAFESQAPKPRLLGEILVSQGYLVKEQFDFVLRVQGYLQNVHVEQQHDVA